MEIKIKWKYLNTALDIDTMELIDLPALKEKSELDATISARKDEHSCNYDLIKIHTGDRESSNALAKEICRRWNSLKKEKDK